MQSNEFLFILYRNPLHKPTHRATPISLRSEAMALAVAALVLLTLLSRKETQDNVRAKGGRTFFLLCAVGWPPIGLAPPLFPFLCPFVLRGLTVLEDFNFSFNFLSFHPPKNTGEAGTRPGVDRHIKCGARLWSQYGNHRLSCGVCSNCTSTSLYYHFFLHFLRHFFFLVKNVAKSDDDPSFSLHADRFVVLIVFAAPF